jgi:hypothetical protein
MTDGLSAIASDYYAPFDAGAPDDDPNLRRSSEAATRIAEIVDTDLNEGWALIVALADLAPTQEAIDLLGAGPLEDFVRAHAVAYLDRIDEAARRSEKFRSALTYTYGWNAQPDSVRARLLPYFPEGPDGPPLRVTFPNAD